MQIGGFFSENTHTNQLAQTSALDWLKILLGNV
jgi:hypothetical protein